jgi:DNA-binding NarL/FixJ family response regulator
MSEIKILIVDDHQLFGLGLKELLLKQTDYQIIGPLKELNEINSTIQTQSPQLILLDINLAGINGIDLGKKLKVDFLHLKIIMLTMYEHAAFLQNAKDVGMDGYLLKDCDFNELLQGINAVLEGGTCFMKIKGEQFPILKDAFGDKLKLSEREIEISKEICNGLNNNEIAEKLRLSFHTIKTHRKNIYTKLGISHVTELKDILKL